MCNWNFGLVKLAISEINDAVRCEYNLRVQRMTDLNGTAVQWFTNKNGHYAVRLFDENIICFPLAVFAECNLFQPFEDDSRALTEADALELHPVPLEHTIQDRKRNTTKKYFVFYKPDAPGTVHTVVDKAIVSKFMSAGAWYYRQNKERPFSRIFAYDHDYNCIGCMMPTRINKKGTEKQ